MDDIIILATEPDGAFAWQEQALCARVKNSQRKLSFQALRHSALCGEIGG